MIVSVKAGLPAATLAGETAVMETDPDGVGVGEGVGPGVCGAEYPPPQPDTATTRIIQNVIRGVRHIDLISDSVSLGVQGRGVCEEGKIWRFITS